MALASDFLRVRVLATPLMFLSFFTVYLFQAFGKGRISLFLGVTRWLVFNIPMLFLLNALVGMYGIVWSQVTADTLTVLTSFLVFWKYRPKFVGPMAPVETSPSHKKGRSGRFFLSCPLCRSVNKKKRPEFFRPFFF